MMHTFTGYRPNPPEEYRDKGITNGGIKADYEGVVFDDGTVVVRWLTAFRSHSVWRDWTDFHQVHGHPEYGTIIQFHEFPPPRHGYVYNEHMLGEKAGLCLYCDLKESDPVHR